MKYKWYAFDGSAGNDVCVERIGGTYRWSVHDGKYPDPPTCWIQRNTPEQALAAVNRAMKRYNRPFGES